MSELSPPQPSEPVPVVLHPAHPPGVDDALRAVAGIELIAASDADEVAAALAEGAPALVTFRWEDRFLVPSLRWIQSISAGTEQFPHDRLRAAGVVLTSARGVHGPQMADHAFALLLALTRRVGPAMRDTAERAWRPRMGYELAGATLGVLGLGAIGEEVARRGAAWGMRVIGTKRDPSRYLGVAEEVRGPEGTRWVCAEADALVVVLPGGDDTRHLIGRDELRLLGTPSGSARPPGVRPGWLVNVGRGTVVDEAALVDAIRAGEIRGAGLDVFEEEPLPPGSPLWSMPEVVITPHTGGLSPAYGPRLARIVEANLPAVRSLLSGVDADGSTWRNRVV